MTVRVVLDDLSSVASQSLIAEHLAGMQRFSPPGSVHALAVQHLRAPEVTCWTAWIGDDLCGCGALKELDATAGEVKSMRTRSAHLQRGVAQAILDEIIRSAQARGYAHLYLETGTGDAFDAAHALYRKNGFVPCGSFGEYVATDFNCFMVMSLTRPTESA